MSKVKVTVKTEVPPASGKWMVDVGDDPVQQLAYSNLTYDLVAKAMARIGFAMSEWVLTGDDSKIRSLQKEAGDD